MTRAREAARLIGNNTFRLDSNNAVGFNSTTPDAMFDINHGLTVAGVSTFTGNVTMEGDLTVQGTTTTLDTTLQEVDLINVQANASVPAIGVTQSGSGPIIAAYDSTSEVFRVDDGGNVGVGENSPMSLLHVKSGDSGASSVESGSFLTVESNGNSAIQMLSGTSNNNYIYFGDSGDTNIGAIQYSHGANALIFHANTLERLRITSGGSVGINTTNPSATLEVASTGEASLNIVADSDSNGSNNDSLLNFRTNGNSGTASAVIKYDESQTNFGIETNGTRALSIDTSQRVMLGTTSARGIGHATAAALEIEATSGTVFASVVKNSNDAYGSSISLGKTRGTSVGSNTSVNDDDEIGSIRFAAADGTDVQTRAAQITAAVDGTPGSNDMPGRLVFSTTADGASSPTERLRIDSSGRLLQGKTATKGSTGENVPTYCTEIASNNPNVLEIANNGTASGSYSALVLSRSDGTSVNSHTSVDSGDKIGEVCFIGADGSDRFNTAASVFVEAEADFTANDCPARLILATNAGGATVSERLRIDSRGSFQFSNGFMNETVNINSTARNGTQDVDLDDGMVHYFTASATGSWKPNFTMSSGNDINATIATGDTFSVTMIVNKANSSHYSTGAQVDGSDITVEFAGGTPSEGGGNNTFDVYHYTIIKTGDDAFIAFVSITNYE